MGTPKNFGQFVQALRALARVPSATSKPVAAALTRATKKNFRSGQDAYGRAYAPLLQSSIDRGRRPPPLRKYARFASVKPLPRSGVAMVVDHPQAGFHQTGTRYMAKRIVVPDGALPATWRAIVEREYKRLLKARLAS